MSGFADAQRPRDLDPLVGPRGRHADVGEHRVGPLPFDRRGQRVAIAAEGDGVDVFEAGDDPLQRLAHEERVLADHDPNVSSGSGCLRRRLGQTDCVTARRPLQLAVPSRSALS